MEELNLDLQSTPNIVPLDLNSNNDKTKITITKSEETSPSLEVKKVSSQPSLSIFTKEETAKPKVVPTMGLDLLTDKKKVIKDNSSNDTQSNHKDDILSRSSDKPMLSSTENTVFSGNRDISASCISIIFFIIIFNVDKSFFFTMKNKIY